MEEDGNKQYQNYYEAPIPSQKLKLKYHQHVSKHSKQDLLSNTLLICLAYAMEKDR